MLQRGFSDEQYLYLGRDAGVIGTYAASPIASATDHISCNSGEELVILLL